MRDYRGVPSMVVGGSRGIGRAVARQLFLRGADVALLARSLADLQATVRELESLRRSRRQKLSFHVLDVTDPDQSERALREVMAEWGRPPQLVFICSGVCTPGVFESSSEALARRTMAVNFFGVRNVVSSVLPAMRAAGGVIVPTASVAAFIGLYGYTDYSASKFAVLGFAEALRGELVGSGVRIAVLCPPDTDTPGLAEERKTRPPETEAISATASLLSADEVAAYALARLASRDFLIVPGRSARFTCWVKRLFPGLVYAKMDATVSTIRRRLAAGRATLPRARS